MILRTIHVGVGGRGTWPIEVMGKDPKFKPVAIVDIHATHARMAQYQLEQAGHRAVPIFSGLTGAVSQIEADALIICTPTKTHADYARMGFAVNAHVLVEKGMTTDWNEAKSLVADADTAWLKFCVAQNYRYTACEQTITYILGKPDHPFHPGKVRMVDYIHHRHRPAPKEMDYPFAMVFDMSCHHVDSLSCWLGKVKRVTARSYAAPWTTFVHEANISAFLEYESGAVCNYVLTHDSMINQWRVVLQGDRGALVLTNQTDLAFFPKPVPPVEGAEAGGAEEKPVPCDTMDCPSPEQCIADDFFQYIVQDIEPGISGKKNLETVAVCEMLVRSAKTMKVVERGELGEGRK